VGSVGSPGCDMEAPRENCGWGNRPRTAALVGSREHPSSTSQTRPPRRHSGQISRNRRGVLSLSRGGPPAGRSSRGNDPRPSPRGPNHSAMTSPSQQATVNAPRGRPGRPLATLALSPRPVRHRLPDPLQAGSQSAGTAGHVTQNPIPNPFDGSEFAGTRRRRLAPPTPRPRTGRGGGFPRPKFLWHVIPHAGIDGRSPERPTGARRSRVRAHQNHRLVQATGFTRPPPGPPPSRQPHRQAVCRETRPPVAPHMHIITAR